MDTSFLAHYKSASQKARVFGEGWIASEFRCPSCTRSLHKTPNNTVAKDFVCVPCGYGFELKSKRGAFGETIADGAYQSMLTSIRSGHNAHLILLSYTENYEVRNVVAIPRHFLVEEIVVPRKPLGPHCRRAGWQGCNLNVGLLPPEGRVTCVSDFARVDAQTIRLEWGKASFLEKQPLRARGWLAVTMGLVRRLNKEHFSLQELYALEDVALKAFPNNSHIREKLRQQLQRLRDLGWLKFLGNGHYQICR